MTWTKSAKLKAGDGVFTLNPLIIWPPGVDIIDEGRGVFFAGGVDGGGIGVLLTFVTGEGDAAR